ncbi:MAG: hypothetical protein K2X27_04825 [Candidatus Obscuribacterales bacterium]|nr:hypothetical protein [Candidatus Obscuribacterales bacterium]
MRNFILLAVVGTIVAAGLSTLSVEASSTSGKKLNSKDKKRKSYSYGLVPPPPPTAVSPTVLAAYPQISNHNSLHFLPSKPKHLVDEMKLTAVLDDVAFFNVKNADQSVRLSKGKSYQSVTLAQINSDQVVLEEKGTQYIKRLR